MRIHKNLIGLCLVVLAWSFAGAAFAVTPANSLLTNQAKLTYTGNSTGITASVSVKVQLVEAAVTAISEPGDVSITEGGAYTATYVVQSNANGYDTYDVTATLSDADNDVTGESAGFTETFPTTISLGASALLADVASGATSFTVPGDGDGSATIPGVNGIEDGDLIVINSVQYRVATVVEDADPTKPATITIDTSGTGGFPTSLPALTLGEGVYEYKSFTTSLVTVGSQDPGTAPFELVVDVNIAPDGNAALDYDKQVTISVVAIVFNKYVRNVTTSVAGTGAPVAYDSGAGSNNYYAAGVEAKPGETLEYLLVAETDPDAGVSGAVIADTLPEFTTYSGDLTAGAFESTKVDGVIVNDEGTTGNPDTNTFGKKFPLSPNADNGGLLLGPPTGAGAEGDGTSVAGGTIVRVVYQVVVDNTP